MKRYLNTAIGILFVVWIGTSLGASGKVYTSSHKNLRSATATKLYAGSQIDTVIFTNQDVGLSALSFAAHFKDSVLLVDAQVYRIIDGYPMAVQTLIGDTLTQFLAYDDHAASTAGSSLLNTIALIPAADEYWVIVTYDAASGQGKTTPNVRYEFNKTLNR